MNTNEKSFLVCILLACTIAAGCNLESSLKQNLVKGQFWDYYLDNPIEPGPYCFQLLADGKCYYYSYRNWSDKSKTERVKFKMGDLLLPETWSLKGDTEIILQGNKRIITHIAKDTIFIKNPVTKDSEMLIRSRYKPSNS